MWTFDTPGPHSIQACFSAFGGLSGYSSSESVPFHQSVGTLTATSTALASSKNPSAPGDQVTYTATVTGGDGGGTVMFTDAGTPVSGCEAVRARPRARQRARRPSPTSGRTRSSASYGADAGFAGSNSATVNQNVAVPAPAPLAGVAGTNVGDGAAEVTFNAGAPAPGAPAPHASAPVAAAAQPVSGITGYNVYVGTTPGGESATPVNSSRIWAPSERLHCEGPHERHEVLLRRARRRTTPVWVRSRRRSRQRR